MTAAAHRQFQAKVERERRRRLYENDPLLYAKQRMGVVLTPDQEAILLSIRDHRRTLVKASHAIGKTYLAGVAANWWYDRAHKSIAYITAPTWKQALGLTFKEVKRYRQELSLPGEILNSGIVRDEKEEKQYAHYIRALNADSGEGFQGEHSAPILIILEEGVGVPSYIWEAVEGLMTNPECRMLVIGNPTYEATEFGIAAESPSYNVLSISALNHPNITAELHCQPPPFPDAVRLLWLYEMMVKECERIDELSQSAFEWWSLPAIANALQGIPLPANAERWFYLPTGYFEGRALGEFPTQADQNVIPRAWLNHAPQLPLTNDEPELGCDTARFGDDRSTIFGRIASSLLLAKELRKMDSNAVAVAIEDAAREMAAHYHRITGNTIDPKRIRIKIDVTGGMGTGPFDILNGKGYRVLAVNSSEKPNNEEQFRNVRSELWFDTRERARAKRLDMSRLPKDVRERLIRELAAPKYSVKGGHKVVEEKAEMKKRLSYSPDLADGLNLAFYAPPKRSASSGSIYD